MNEVKFAQVQRSYEEARYAEAAQDDDGFDPAEVVEATPSMWIEVMGEASQRDWSKPLDLSEFRGLSAAGVQRVCQESTDCAELLTLALNDPEKWAVKALNRIRHLCQQTADYALWLESAQDSENQRNAMDREDREGA